MISSFVGQSLIEIPKTLQAIGIVPVHLLEVKYKILLLKTHYTLDTTSQGFKLEAKIENMLHEE